MWLAEHIFIWTWRDVAALVVLVLFMLLYTLAWLEDVMRNWREGKKDKK